MIIVTAEEMKELDRHAIDDLGIPISTLMDNAGCAVAEEAARIIVGNKIVVICGRGKNGGDGLIAAKLLSDRYNMLVKIVSLGKTGFEPSDYELVFQESDLIIDALFGIGLNAEVKSPFLEIITLINSLNKPVLSVDVPSGLNATTGEVVGTAIIATETITFAAAKTGFYKNEGPKHCGKIVVVDIGIPI